MEEYDKREFGRIRLNRSEVIALVTIIERTKPYEISNMNGERFALATIMKKLMPLLSKIQKEKKTRWKLIG